MSNRFCGRFSFCSLLRLGFFTVFTLQFLLLWLDVENKFSMCVEVYEVQDDGQRNALEVEWENKRINVSELVAMMGIYMDEADKYTESLDLEVLEGYLNRLNPRQASVGTAVESIMKRLHNLLSPIEKEINQALGRQRNNMNDAQYSNNKENADSGMPEGVLVTTFTGKFAEHAEHLHKLAIKMIKFFHDNIGSIENWFNKLGNFVNEHAASLDRIVKGIIDRVKHNFAHQEIEIINKLHEQDGVKSEDLKFMSNGIADFLKNNPTIYKPLIDQIVNLIKNSEAINPLMHEELAAQATGNEFNECIDKLMEKAKIRSLPKLDDKKSNSINLNLDWSNFKEKPFLSVEIIFVSWRNNKYMLTMKLHLDDFETLSDILRKKATIYFLPLYDLMKEMSMKMKLAQGDQIPLSEAVMKQVKIYFLPLRSVINGLLNRIEYYYLPIKNKIEETLKNKQKIDAKYLKPLLDRLLNFPECSEMRKEIEEKLKNKQEYDEEDIKTLADILLKKAHIYFLPLRNMLNQLEKTIEHFLAPLRKKIAEQETSFADAAPYLNKFMSHEGRTEVKKTKDGFLSNHSSSQPMGDAEASDLKPLIGWVDALLEVESKNKIDKAIEDDRQEQFDLKRFVSWIEKLLNKVKTLKGYLNQVMQ